MKNQLGFLSKNYLRTAPSLPFSIRNGGGCSLGDDRIIMFGGSENSDLTDFSNKIIIYNPKTQTSIVSSSTLQIGVNRNSAFSIDNGNAIVCGGASSEVIKSSSHAQEYDYLTDTLISVGDMIASRKDHMSSMMKDGRGYITGGTDQDDVLVNTAERFSFKHKTFSALTVWAIPESEKELVNGVSETLICRGNSSYQSYSPSNDSAITKTSIDTSISYYGIIKDMFGLNIIFGGIGTTESSFIKKYNSELDIEFNSGLKMPHVINSMFVISNESGNLIAGGIDGSDNILNSCYEYKSIIKDIPNIETAIMGGENLSSSLDSCMSFNSETETARVIGNLPSPVTESEGNYFEQNGDNFPILMGGSNTIGGSKTDISYKIDILNEIFSTVSGTLPSARSNLMSASVTIPGGDKRRIFATGGIDNLDQAKKDSWYYNQASESFVSCNPLLPSERYNAAMASVNINDVFHASLAGGYDLSNTMRDEIFDFESQDETFIQTGNLPVPKAGISSSEGDGFAYFIGGYAVLGSPTNTIYRYDYNLKTITVMPFNMIISRMFHNSFTNSLGKIIVLGGESSTAIESSIEKIDFKKGISSIISDMPVAKKSASISGQTNEIPSTINLLPKSNFSIESEKMVFNSGNSSVKLKSEKTQNYEIFVNEGDIVHVVLYLKKSVDYTDSSDLNFAPKIILIGCGGVDSVIANNVSDSEFIQYNLSLTTLKSGLVELIISNRSEKTSSLLYIDDIGVA